MFPSYGKGNSQLRNQLLLVLPNSQLWPPVSAGAKSQLFPPDFPVVDPQLWYDPRSPSDLISPPVGTAGIRGYSPLCE